MPDFLMTASPAQREAVTFEGPGPLLVLAGPGSGKTFTITHRLRFLLQEKQVSPESILVLTFTRDAALSMQKRFLQESDLPQHLIQSVNFGTFHSIFYHILKQSTGISDHQIVSEAEKRKLLLPVLSVFVPQSSYAEQVNGAKEILTAMSYYKNTGEMEKARQKVPQIFQDHFSHILETYEKERRRRGKLDFDDMLTDCRILLEENRGLRDYWQKRFAHILIDEFQDINPAQYRVIKLLSAPPHSIFAVGDDDQAIYGFRGSDPACMREFVEEFHAKKFFLDKNYRSSPEIVEACRAVIADNKNRFQKTMTAGSGKRGSVFVYGFRSAGEETEYLLRACQKAGDCAVLFRTNRLMQRFAADLRRRKINFEMKEKSQNIYDQEVVQDVMAYLRMGAGEVSRELLLRVINKPSRYISREAFHRAKRMAEEAGLRSHPVHELLEFYAVRNPGTADELRRLEKQLEALKKMSPYLALQYVRRVIGYDRWLLEKYAGDGNLLQEDLELLEWLTEDARQYQDLCSWLKFQRENDKGKRKEGSELRLMTVHAAKGLEFEHVIIPDCNERIFPYGHLQDAGTVEEERRIFYVGMTRAKTTLELLYRSPDKEQSIQISRFLNEKLLKKK